MSRKQSDRCVFCNWTRRNSWPNIRFFNIPREPGLKRVRWLQAFGDRKISHRDRVCSVHFRSGRPTNDPSHEDFAPHLYLNSEPPADVMQFLENTADKDGDNAKILAADASVEMIGDVSPAEKTTKATQGERLLPLLPPKKHVGSRPAIMQRKRKVAPKSVKEEGSPDSDENNDSPSPVETASPVPVELNVPKVEVIEEPPNISYEKPSNVPAPIKHLPNLGRNVRVFPINRCLIDIAGIRVGQNVIIKRRSDTETKSSVARTREPSLVNDYPVYNMMANNKRRRPNQEMVPPPMIHMNMEDGDCRHDGKYMEDSQYTLPLQQEQHQFKVEMPNEHLFPNEYPDDMFYDHVYDEYEESVDPAVLTANSR
uniref:THAP-type domain-containing protein n=1 Tax=Panagrolaimus sp. JU765 TaxID=591449 RepID=A0AC34QEQ4_9BILA